MTEIFNKEYQTKQSQILRKNMPPAEHLLWIHLKRKQLEGYKFRRQYGIGKFIVDFYCAKAKLAIEIDGDSHFFEKRKMYDKERDNFIRSLGITLLRFQNPDIYEDLERVISDIQKYLKSKSVI